MPIWDKVKQELDRAGRVAQDALDEGKFRLDAFRERQHADKAAQALGYALYRARTAGGDLDQPTYERLASTLERHEAEATKLESHLDGIQDRRKSGYADEAEAPSDQQSAPPEPPPPSAETISPTDTGAA